MISFHTPVLLVFLFFSPSLIWANCLRLKNYVAQFHAEFGPHLEKELINYFLRQVAGPARERAAEREKNEAAGKEYLTDFEIRFLADPNNAHFRALFYERRAREELIAQDRYYPTETEIKEAHQKAVRAVRRERKNELEARINRGDQILIEDKDYIVNGQIDRQKQEVIFKNQDILWQTYEPTEFELLSWLKRN